MSRLKRLKKIRIHREGTHTLAGSLALILTVNTALYFGLECKVPFYVVAVISLIVYGDTSELLPLSHPVCSDRKQRKS